MNNQQYARLLLTFIAAAIFIAAGAFGLLYFTNNSKYMTQIGQQPIGSLAYNVKDVLSLLLFATAAPVGFILLLHFIATITRLLTFNKYSPTSNKLSTFIYCVIVLATASTFITISVFAYHWSRHVLQCGFIFCIGDNWPQPTSIDPPIGPDGEGFRSTIAAPAILLSVAIALSLLVILCRELLNRCLQSFQPPSATLSSISAHSNDHSDLNEKLLNQSLNDNSSSGPAHPVLNSQSYTPFNTTFQIKSINGALKKVHYNPQPPILIRLTIQFILLFVLLSSIYVVASYVPNQFRSYWPSYIARFAKLEVVNDPQRCIMKGTYSCPDLYKASFHTHQIRLSDDLNLKLFPSNTIYYTFIMFALLFPVVTRMIPTVDEFLSRKVVIPIPSIFFLCQSRRKSVTTLTKTYWSLYEIALFLWFILGSYLFFSYCFFDRNWKERQASSDKTTFWDDMMRSSGQVAVVFLSLLMFPVARSSPLLSLFGIGWDKALNFHRWLGVLFLVMAVWHAVSAYLLFYEEAGWSGVVELLWPYPPIKVLENQDNFTIPIIQVVTWFAIITIGVIAGFEPIRRCVYDFFLISHHITYMVLIPTVLWHGQASWEYLLPALCFYLGDRLLRLYRGVQSVALHTTFVKDFQPNPLDNNNLSFMSMDDHVGCDEFTLFSPRSISFNRKLPAPITTIYAPKEHHLIPAPLHGPNNLPAHNYNVNPPGVRLLDYGVAGKYVELNIVNAATDFVYFPGQFFFINIAEISLFEYHPMTVSSSIHAIKSSTISFLIKCTGTADSWTNNLYTYIDKIVTQQLSSTQYDNRLDVPLTISLDGPYGQPIDFTKYENIILCCGGSGITPVKSIYESLWLSFLHDFVPTLPGTGKEKLKQQLLMQHCKTTQLNSLTTIPSNPITVHDEVGPNGDLIHDTEETDETLFHIPKRVHIFAAARDASFFECMLESLSNIPKKGSPFSAELFCSQNGESIPIQTDKDDFILNTPSVDHTVPVIHHLQHHFSTQHLDRKSSAMRSEPEPLSCLESSIRSAFSIQDLHHFKQSNQNTIIFVCGPQRLTEEAKAVAAKYGLQFHEEAFEL